MTSTPQRVILITERNDNQLIDIMKTQIDTQKEQADFLIEYANGGSFTINTKGKEISGRGVKKQHGNGNYEVTRNKLESLKQEMTWHVNF